MYLTFNDIDIENERIYMDITKVKCLLNKEINKDSYYQKLKEEWEH